jgi:hypothetical protein
MRAAVGPMDDNQGHKTQQADQNKLDRLKRMI